MHGHSYDKKINLIQRISSIDQDERIPYYFFSHDHENSIRIFDGPEFCLII